MRFVFSVHVRTFFRPLTFRIQGPLFSGLYLRLCKKFLVQHSLLASPMYRPQLSSCVLDVADDVSMKFASLDPCPISDYPLAKY